MIGGGLMERYLIEVIGNKLIRNSTPPYSGVYNMFVEKNYMFGIFTKFLLICDFYF